MMDSFVTVDELQARLDFDLEESERRDAEGALEELTGWAKHYGKSSWTWQTVPFLVKSLIISAAKRYIRNPDGYRQSRAGEEVLVWGGRDEEGSAEFSATQIKAIRALAKHTGFGTINTFSGRATTQDLSVEYVPVQGGGSIPYYRNGEPW